MPVPSNGGDACPCHLTAATHARAVVAAAAHARAVVAAAAQRRPVVATAAQRAHVIAAGRAAGAVAAATATSLHADTAGIHILSRVGVTSGIVAFGHFYIQTGDFLYASNQPFNRRKSPAFCI
jgi:hypothetical protein